MRRDLEEKLFNDFPTFFRGHDAGDANKTLMVFGFCCGDGWFDLIYNLCKNIKGIAAEEFMVVQIKEKFGGLRFYTVTANKEIFDLIQKAADDSYKICEKCGRPGILRITKTHWYKTLCDSCGKDYVVALEVTK